ncbi:unnamed protein product [Tilletia controversa]|nr:unnamed protein product [Tilletia controversa]
MLSASRVLRSSASQAVRAASASGAISAGPSISTASISTLSTLNALPEGTVYRQATEALTSHRLSVIENALSQNKTINEDVIKSVEDKLDVGLIEEVVMQANDELGLVAKMIDWKASEPLEHPPPAGQWKYFDMREEAGEGDEIK